MSSESAHVREFFDAHVGAWDEMHESFYDETVVAALAGRCNLDGLGINNVTLAEAPADRLPLDDDAAGAAVANMVLHHAPDPAAMLTEMARVVRRGGAAAITDGVSHHHEWMRTEQADVWLGFDRDQLAEWFGGAGLVEFDHAPLGTA